MIKTYSIEKRMLAMLLCIAMVLSYLPGMVWYAEAAVTANGTRITDTSTANSYTDMLGTDDDGNRYSGRIWSDKSVFSDATVDLGDTGIAPIANDSDFMVVYSALGSTTSVSSTTVVGGALDVIVILDNSMSMSNGAGSTGNGGPNSGSTTTRLQAVTEAANDLIDDILENETSRLAVVTYSTGAATLLPLDFYEQNTSDVLTVNSYSNGGGGFGGGNSGTNGGKMTATAVSATTSETVTNTNSGYQSGTNLQAGIDMAMDILKDASNTTGRAPVVIVLTDGVADTAVDTGWYEVSTTNSSTDADTVHPAANTITAGVALSTLLNAAYKTSLVEKKYGSNPTVYGVGVDLGTTSDAFVVMDPKTAFNSTFSTLSSKAYGWYEQWLAGTEYTQSETISRSTYNWDFSLPSGLTADEQAALKADVEANINFVDYYYNVSAAGTGLSGAFDSIVQNMNQGVFHPITDTVVIGGETSDTPLTYVDFIGDYMEVKDIKAVTLFGNRYNVTAGTATTTEVDNGDGTYTVTATTPFIVGNDTDMIVHPIMNITTAVGDSVKIELIETYTLRQTDSALVKSSVSDQQLWIYIDENALPLIYDEIIEEASGKTTYTRTEAEPIRVYYTVGLTDDIKAEDGTVMTSRISAEYLAANTAADGTVYFYANQYGQMNGSTVVDVDGNVVSQMADGTNYFYRTGDAHTSAAPSDENRYYYHLANQGIFTQVTDTQSANGAVSWEENEFGVEWEEDRYALTWLTYEAYRQYMADLANGTDHQVYTYVSFYRPLDTAAEDGSTGEKVTYLVFTQWSLLCNDIAFYDHINGVYINYDAETKTISTGASGNYIDLETLPEGVDVASIISAYVSNIAAYAGEEAKAVTAADIYAVLGIGSLRMPRLSNMAKSKQTNETGTAYYAYVPTRDADDETDHIGDLVVWLGNNGRLAVDPTQGLALSKTVSDLSEEDGAPTVFEFEITVVNSADFDASRISVMDAYGNLIDTSVWSVGVVAASNGGYTCTINVSLADGETVYVVNIPAGAAYAVEEVNADKYYEVNFVNGAGTVVNNTITPVTITNDAIDYADLYITKEIVHSQAGQTVPEAILAEEFSITVNFGAALAGKTFTLEKTDSAASQITVEADGTNELTIKHGQTIAVRDIPAGSEITVTETNVDTHFTVSYRSRNHSGNNADSDSTVILTVDGDNSTHDAATVVVTNTYKPTYVTVDLDIDGTKNLNISNAPTNKAYAFSFQVQEHVNGEWVNMLADPATVSYAAGQNGEQTFEITDVLEGIIYDTVGTYTYQVVEVIPADKAEGITYDRTLYTFTVVIEDVGGALKATVYDLNNDMLTSPYEVTFVNTYHTAPISIDVKKTVKDNNASAQGFLFEIYPVILADGVPSTDENGNWKYSSTAEVSMRTDGIGEVRYTKAYEEAGSYYYVIKEINESKTGWTYDPTVYELQIVVTEAADGGLTANLIVDGVSRDSNTAALAFENVYTPVETYLDLDVIPTVSKVLTGRELIAADNFTFYVYEDGDRTDILSTGTVGEKMGNAYKVVFDKELTFTEAGTYYYDIVEGNGGQVIDGVTYDPTVYDMVVEVVDDNGQLKASYYFEDAVSQTVTFTNVYRVTGTAQLDLSGTKTLTGRSLAEGEFAFSLVGVDENGQQVRSITTANHSDNDGDGIGAIIFPTITYTAAHVGHTYTYTVSEVKNGLGGVTYDEDTYTIVVAVTDDGKGGITLDIQGDAPNALNFENAYEAEGTSVVLTGTKTMLGGRPLGDYEFRFNVHEGEALVASGTNVGNNIVFAQIDYDMDDVGLHTYEVTEADTSLPGITYDGSSYTVTVNVTDDGKGQIHAYVTYTDGDLKFTNTYSRQDAEVEISGRKVLTGRDLKAGEFTFGIYRADAEFNVFGDALLEVTNEADGSFSFGKGEFSQPGTYYYVVTESDNSLGGVTYDKAEYYVTIEIKDNVDYDGKMTATTTIKVGEDAADEIVFNNEYAASGTVDIQGRKVLEGGTLAADMFQFELYDETGKLMQTGNLADGSIVFEDVPLTGAKTHTFTVIEQVPTSRDEGMIYDVTAYTVTVEVTDNLDGTLTAAEPIYSIGTNTVDEMVFTNSIHDILVKEVVLAQTGVNVDNKKVENGDILEYFITYTNTTGQTVDAVITDTIPANTTFVENSAGNGVYENGKLTWTLNDVAAGDVVTVSFKVEVTASDSAEIKNKAQVWDGTNTYHSNETVTGVNKASLSIKKEQIVGSGNATAEKVTVKEGDVVTYILTVTNSGEGDAYDITVTDKLPEGLIYVDKSISVGGVYADGVVTWVLDTLAAGDSVELTFKIKVPAVKKDTTWTNVATFVYGNDPEGEDNITESNKVDLEEKYEVPDVKDTTSPQTGDNFNASLFISLMVISSFGLAAVMVCKKKEEEKETAQ